MYSVDYHARESSRWTSDVLVADVPPSSASFAAAADGAILPLVLFSVLFGLAATRIDPELREKIVGVARAVGDTRRAASLAAQHTTARRRQNLPRGGHARHTNKVKKPVLLQNKPTKSVKTGLWKLAEKNFLFRFFHAGISC